MFSLSLWRLVFTKNRYFGHPNGKTELLEEKEKKRKEKKRKEKENEKSINLFKNKFTRMLHQSVTLILCLLH